MNEPYDPLALENQRLSPEEVAVFQQNAVRPVSRYGKQPKIQFMKIPIPLSESLEQLKADWTVYAIFRILYMEWYSDPNHYNPVPLTSCALRRVGISRWQKYRALSILEKTGLISVFREKSKNPQVLLNWLPLKEPGGVGS
jgi:hypothetical protein